MEADVVWANLRPWHASCPFIAAQNFVSDGGLDPLHRLTLACREAEAMRTRARHMFLISLSDPLLMQVWEQCLQCRILARCTIPPLVSAASPVHEVLSVLHSALNATSLTTRDEEEGKHNIPPKSVAST